MSLDDLIYSLLGVDHDVALVSDENVFKKSVDHDINNPFSIEINHSKEESKIEEIVIDINSTIIETKEPIQSIPIISEKPKSKSNDIDLNHANSKSSVELVKQSEPIKPIKEKKIPIQETILFKREDNLEPTLDNLKLLYHELQTPTSHLAYRNISMLIRNLKKYSTA
jgi:hypothetical protein